MPTDSDKLHADLPDLYQLRQRPDRPLSVEGLVSAVQGQGEGPDALVDFQQLDEAAHPVEGIKKGVAADALDLAGQRHGKARGVMGGEASFVV